ncbi:MAG: hypothetical protein QN120_02580, partial [Armatimonadota bacterium]|nr:hypothetical protein [Armatimonadota bacterium]
PPGGGPDLRLQLRTAVAHAQNAAASEALRGAQSHLLHVVNCLEGPRGRDYAQAEINPCQGQGNGILVDLRSNPGRASWVPVAEAAKDLAMRGSKLGELASARASARGVAALLATVAENVR